ncbi:type II toxin-antitoxin system PemK/MazF family toxin [Demequina sp.]|uniref:type II toxin-antitoxin system PemK/MazF family toxin n=1 Tax=Demequina sp. TaxID=2050685 RepID=UPI003D10BB5B
MLWADFGSPRGSEPAKRRPAIVLQDDWLLRSAFNTVIVVPLTSNTELASFPGNVLVTSAASGLDRDSVALVAQITSVGRKHLDPYPAATLPAYLLDQIKSGVRLAIGAG